MKSNGSATADFQSEWQNRVVKATSTDQKPTIQAQKTADGWEVTTGFANVKHLGITFTCILITATGFGKEMSVMVNIAGENYMASVDKFLNDMDLDSTATVASKSSKQNDTNSGSLNDYSFIVPETWFTQKANNYILLSQTQNPEWGCLISVFPTEASSGNLEEEARTLFNNNYSGWEYRNSGDKKEDVSKGYTSQGLPYVMIEAEMKKKRPDGYYYDYENGQIIVIGAGNKKAVIQARHNRGEMTCFCNYSYDHWDRFFDSFTINNVSPEKQDRKNDAKRIVGTWGAQGGSALTKYIFAGNGHYQFIGAYSTTSLINYNTIELKTSGFKGDGTYSLKGDKLTTSKFVDKNNVDIMQYRFDQVNHGGTGWKDRVYLFTPKSFDGKPNEVRYERQEN
ncbi:MAG: hypothetical protein ACJ748_10735 [Flavisolibacter sp.]